MARAMQAAEHIQSVFEKAVEKKGCGRIMYLLPER